MFFHMKTTLHISDPIMKQLKTESARTGKTMSELVETALRELFGKGSQSGELPPLPSFRGGKPKANLADRDSLYTVMEER
jgi:hypothetical protein